MKTFASMNITMSSSTGTVPGSIICIDGHLYLYNDGTYYRVENSKPITTDIDTTKKVTFNCGDIMKVY